MKTEIIIAALIIGGPIVWSNQPKVETHGLSGGVYFYQTQGEWVRLCMVPNKEMSITVACSEWDRHQTGVKPPRSPKTPSAG